MPLRHMIVCNPSRGRTGNYKDEKDRRRRERKEARRICDWEANIIRVNGSPVKKKSMEKRQGSSSPSPFSSHSLPLS